MDMSLFPTKSNLMKAKHSLELAQLGYELMDKKRVVLVKEMMSLFDDAKAIQSEIDDTFAAAYHALQVAFISLGVSHEIALSVPVDDSLELKYRSVMGIEIPTLRSTEPSPAIYYGLSSSNSLLDEAYMKFRKVKELTLKLAEIENSIYRLATNVKKVQKRTNALSNIIIPRYTQVIYDITNALEEKEREEFSRLKVIKNTKQ
ncbi:MAG: V-type ATP synthase subunit D [Clostridia bacterium]|nr:V-type ATP synthase subunit D [Clostridia bacterium]MBQ4248497.1 V-type ATP synthase subunit D [Clostridia bacterium]